MSGQVNSAVGDYSQVNHLGMKLATQVNSAF